MKKAKTASQSPGPEVSDGAEDNVSPISNEAHEIVLPDLADATAENVEVSYKETPNKSEISSF